MGHYFKKLELLEIIFDRMRNENFTDSRKLFHTTLMQRAPLGEALLAWLHKDTRVSKLVDYNQLLPQYVTYRIYRYFGNGREPLTVLDMFPKFGETYLLHKPNLD